LSQPQHLRLKRRECEGVFDAAVACQFRCGIPDSGDARRAGLGPTPASARFALSFGAADW
jgi:hypothetical protein